jgi:hypothetical protein
VNDGILSKEAYQEWAGKYIHRSYEKHLGLKGAITNIKQIPDYLRGRMGESKSIAPIKRLLVDNAAQDRAES